MISLVTPEQLADIIGGKKPMKPETIVRLMDRLGVPKIDFSIVGGKGIRYRLADFEAALEKAEIKKNKPRRKPKAPAPDLFDRPISEQVRILTTSGPTQ